MEWYVYSSVATVLTACGIETIQNIRRNLLRYLLVATVLTVYGIETLILQPHEIGIAWLQ